MSKWARRIDTIIIITIIIEFMLRYAMLYAYVEFSAAKFNFNKWSGRPYSAVCKRSSCVCACVFALPLPNMSELCACNVLFLHTNTHASPLCWPDRLLFVSIISLQFIQTGRYESGYSCRCHFHCCRNFLSLFDQCYVRWMIWPVLLNVNCHCARFFRLLFFFSFPL